MERMTSASSAMPVRQGAASTALLLKTILGTAVRKWYWFALALVLAMTGAWFYLQSKVPVYERTASILIKQNGGNATDHTLQELGISQPSTSLTNEILMMRSSVVAAQVVNRLNLSVDYFKKGTFYDQTVYGLGLPLKISFLDLDDSERASLRASLQADGTVTLGSWNRGGHFFADSDISLHLGDTVQTPLGRVSVAASPYYNDGQTANLQVNRSSIHTAMEKVRKHISASLRDKSSSIIDIRYRDASLYRADDILNTLITVYNEQWIENRNKQILSTNDFIRERLSVIENELGDVDENISSFKSEHLIVNVDQAGAMAVAEVSEAGKQDAALKAQISQLRSIYEYLTGMTDDREQIPIASGINNTVIQEKIAEYNSMILQRNNHQSFSSARNPLVVDLNKNLASMRMSIAEALNTEISLLQTQQGNLQDELRQAEGKVAQNPYQANYLLSVERQQKVKESLYLFLLQKREENELSQAFTAYNTQVIEPAHGSWTPVEPVPRNIYLMALVLGLGLPAFVLFLKEMLTTTVQGREDLKQMRIPFAGEIPFATNKKNKKGGRKSVPAIHVQDKNWDAVNEAFRVVRSNLEFLLGFEASHKIIMLTSIEPGSGKTFITANLSTAVALKGKRVLAIDLDLRRASLSAYAGTAHRGLSSFLNGQYEDYHELIVPLGDVDLLPCGAIPPNPSELLYTDRFRQLIECVRNEYDYVFLDCPPVELVADSAIIGRFVDLTLFVVRTGLMEKSLLPEIDQWYLDKKFNNMVILLNGSDLMSGRYGYHRYGYHRYGYR